ncbi:tetratricopeptide repeat protein [Mesonia sp.]|uniref:tetratricopeptide repeat-containing sensor histidine kinase n=1 Tax=Mesonia sp. TaxID=1960830 RepID=UPI00176835D8|nr:tetratricopeptide repeat protein [Mesonia sp.]HIB38553.1 tetratricopeptide repeat protein [Mesonia sp.]
MKDKILHYFLIILFFVFSVNELTAFDFNSSKQDSISYYLDEVKKHYQNDYSLAITNVRLAEKLAVKTNSKKLADVNYSYACVYYVNGNYNKSLQYFLKATKAYKKNDDKIGLSKCYEGIGLIQQAVDRHSIAINYFNKALNLIDENPKQNSTTYLNIAISYIEMRELENAKNFLDLSYEFAKKANRINLIHKVENRRAQILFIEKDFQKSRIQLTELLKNTGLSNWERSFAHTTLAKVYLSLSKLNLAEENALKAFTYAKKTNSLWDLERNTLVLKDIYQDLGDEDRSEYYLHLNGVYKDSLYNSVKLDQLNLQQLEYQETENSNLLLEKEESEKKLLVIKILFVIVVIKTIIGLIFLIKLRKANRQKTKLNKELKLKNSQLQALDQSKNKMFSILSHDLKSPISSLLQLIELLKEGAFTEEERKQVLNEMHLQLTSTSLMLRNLLKWATNQMESSDINLQTVNLIEKVKEVIDVYYVIARNKNVEIMHDFHTDENLNILVDPAHLNVILHNLLSNAVKFTPENDYIKISYSVTDNVCLKIFNKGEPIRDEKIIEIEQKNSKINSEYGTFNERGTGIGLLLVKQYLIPNRATLKITPLKDEGTEFKICFQKA